MHRKRLTMRENSPYSEDRSTLHPRARLTEPWLQGDTLCLYRPRLAGGERYRSCADTRSSARSELKLVRCPRPLTATLAALPSISEMPFLD